MTDDAKKTERLSRAACFKKAEECRNLASIRGIADHHRIMLTHIAETWERIAETASGGNR